MPSVKNIENVKQLTEKIKASKSIVFLDYRGVDASTKSNLRKKVAEMGEVEYLIAKNRLFKVALKNAEIEGGESVLKGPTSFVLSYSDSILAAKISQIFTKECDAFKVKGGFVDSKEVDSVYISKIADLPSREVLLSRLASAMKLPMMRLHRTMEYNLNSLVQVLKSIKK